MDQIPRITLEALPDDILATILQLVAAFPIPEWNRGPPFPITASRLSRRVRALALASPELWSTIRLSHRSRSWGWAVAFVKRSRAYPLDISINLEAYARGRCFAAIPLQRALAIIGPHVSRWRTLSLRGWKHQIEELHQFMVQSPCDPSQLQSAHISVVNPGWEPPFCLPAFGQILRGPTFISFRTNAPPDLADLSAFRNIHTLDMDFGRVFYDPEIFGVLFGPSSPLKTLIMRELPYVSPSVRGPTEAPTITCLTVSNGLTYNRGFSFESLANMFAFPNLVYLEIIGDFKESISEREAPLFPFPHLRTLRLQDLELTRIGLSFLHSISQGITALELICTTENHNLRAAEDMWPELRSLTVKTWVDDVSPNWIPQFLAMRASLGVKQLISTLILSPWILVPLPVGLEPEIRWLADGPSLELMHGLDHGFYVDNAMHPKDFEYVEKAPERRWSYCPHREWDWYQWEIEYHQHQTEEMIEDALAVRTELVRAKGIWRELRKERRREFKDVRKYKTGRRRRQKRCDITEDFMF
ncbi:hypothetical protein K438DRAFT_1842661 [Mycena galopus ATCC 62051]|nr:hypothetical protein K438DRAFT_1842661 [Mycena galopus ATCC 62051]